MSHYRLRTLRPQACLTEDTVAPFKRDPTRQTAAAVAISLLAALVSACGGGAGAGDSAATAAVAPTASTVATAPIAPAPEAPVTSAAATATTTEAAAAVNAEVAAAASADAAASVLQAEVTAATLATKSIEAAPAGFADSLAAAPALAVVPATAAPTTTVLTIRARGSQAGGIGPLMALRVNGNTIGTVEVNSAAFANYSFGLPSLSAGAKVDVVFTNDALINAEDRNLYIAYLSDAVQAVLPSAAGTVYDRGIADKAFDGLDTLAGQGDMAWGGALRLTWPAAPATDTALARKLDAVRFLQQASFGATPSDITNLVAKPYATWMDEQIALPAQADFVNHIQAKYDLGDSYRPKGSNYTPGWVAQKFWATAANSPDQLRKRTAFALHQIFVISQSDSNLWYQARAYANYLDTLNKHAFGNFRNLLEDLALSPAMGIYLSHMRNRKEDAATGRAPDENFAREIMQLFTIGLHELNTDGSLKRDSGGNPIETYNNADVIAMAKVFTGWGWAYPDAQLTDSVFRWSSPSLTAANDTRIDLLPMKAYPGQHSTAEKVLFSGKAWATTLPANGSAATDLRLALDALFNHPNVGPFIGRQLIQRLVTSNPSPAYVGRVAAAFNNNGKGVRGDLAAVLRTILLDAEARNPATAGLGKLLEPVLRVTYWMRAFGAKSASSQYMMAWDLESSAERALYAPSVFGYFRPGYVPPNTVFAAGGATVPEFQIVNESTVAAWLNAAEAMAGAGLGWTGTTNDVVADYAVPVALVNTGSLTGLIDYIDLVMLGGRMSAGLRQTILELIGGIGGNDNTANLYRVRAAVFMALASPDYLVQQ